MEIFLMKTHWTNSALFLGLTGFAAGLANGLLGTGGGTLLVPVLVSCRRLEQHKAHATTLCVILPIAVISAFIYMKNGFMDWPLICKITFSGILGGVTGARLLPKISAGWLRAALGFFMLISGGKMLWTCFFTSPGS
jgi:uncharacterized membrane protein YfcA